MATTAATADIATTDRQSTAEPLTKRPGPTPTKNAQSRLPHHDSADRRRRRRRSNGGRRYPQDRSTRRRRRYVSGEVLENHEQGHGDGRTNDRGGTRESREEGGGRRAGRDPCSDGRGGGGRDQPAQPTRAADGTPRHRGTQQHSTAQHQRRP